MGLTNNAKQLIRALSENNLQKAKQSATACLSEDTTAKNADFVISKKIEIKNLTEDQKLKMIDQYISTIDIKDTEECDKLKRNIIVAIDKNKISDQRDIINTIINEYASILIARNS